MQGTWQEGKICVISRCTLVTGVNIRSSLSSARLVLSALVPIGTGSLNLSSLGDPRHQKGRQVLEWMYWLAAITCRIKVITFDVPITQKTLLLSHNSSMISRTLEGGIGRR